METIKFDEDGKYVLILEGMSYIQAKEIHNLSKEIRYVVDRK